MSRDFAQTAPASPPEDAPARVCDTCSSVYLDYAEGREAHRAVFGHAPELPARQEAS